jgi:thiamine-phosphate pyrophosphorylase
METDLPFRYIAISSRKVCPEPLPQRIQRLDGLGVDCIQVRDKEVSDREKYNWFKQINCFSSLLFANSRADFVHLFNLDGLQRSGKAISAGKLKIITGEKVWIGCSAHNLTDLHNACCSGADFILYSPVFPTESKPELTRADCHGLEGLKQACIESDLPVFALGGIGPDEIKPCLEAGAWGAAGIRTLFQPEDPTENWDKISKALNLS